MSSLIEGFYASLPLWISEIKIESHKKIMRSRLIQHCREGNRAAMKTLMIRYWPFVDEFPEIIRKHQLRISAREFLRHPFDSFFLIDTVSKILSDIRGDEKDHRSLWVDSALALGLSEDGLYKMQYFENPKARFKVHDIVNLVGQSVKVFGKEADSFSALLRLSAVEIVAESISRELLIVFSDLDEEEKEKAEKENREVKIRPSQWFRAHIYHKEGMMSHEELVYRIAFALGGKDPEREKVNGIIGEVVDLFMEAGEIPY